MDSKLVFPLTLLLLATIIDSGSGLNCYQCNSYEDALCADPFYHEGDGVNPGPAKSGDDFLKPCPADTADKEFFCRKIYQNVRGDERVIRSCGWIKDERERECYSTVPEGSQHPSRADGDRINQQTHKNFSQKKRCDHQTNLFDDLRCCLQMRKI